MSDWFKDIPDTWNLMTLGDTLSVLTDYTANGSFESLKNNVTYYSEPNYAVLVRTTDLGKSTFVPQRFTDKKGYDFQRKTSLYGGEIVLANVGSVGKVYLVPNYNMPMTLAPNTYLVKCNDYVDQRFVYQFLISSFYLKGLYRNINSTTLSAINKDNFRSIPIALPPSKKEQIAIRNILESIDSTIKQTDKLIEKYQQIKIGLMQDLFTRGLNEDGNLRPTREQSPELYHKTVIGWIPVDWDAVTLDSIKESLADGPFGSNLKTEHYVTSPGVRVVRLQNLLASSYNDGDKAFISEQHANFLIRNRVVENDILIAGLGEERYPVGRACLYPQGLPPAVNKADCFRLRCNNEAINGFIMYFLNTSLARHQIRKYEQGVTRPRINTGNLKKIYVVKPTIDEQKVIFEQLSKIEKKLSLEQQYLNKLSFKKQGLMHDLLTGKIPVSVDEPEVAHV